MKKRINFTVEENILNQLDSIASVMGLSRSAVISYLTFDFYANHISKDPYSEPNYETMSKLIKDADCKLYPDLAAFLDEMDRLSNCFDDVPYPEDTERGTGLISY